MRISDEISNELDQVEKDINTQRDNLDVLQSRKNELDLELLTIGETIRKAKHTITSMRSRVESLTREYWRSKGK